MKPMELLEQGRFLGEEFLTWLWMKGLAEGGQSGADGDTTACFVDDSVTLISERGDVKNLALSKGNPSESREAFEALSRGMRPAKAKIRILSGDLEWVCTLSSATLDVSGMKLPTSTGKTPHERLHDRLFLVEEGIGHLERRYAAFLRIRQEDQESLQDEIQGWIRAGIEGNAFAGASDDGN
jgi:recombination associated protein RdgC